MIFARKALGMEIWAEGVRMALVGGKREAPMLEACSTASFPPETVRLSHREQNVLNPSAFVAKVREAYLTLLTKTGRVSLSLPDALGRVMILDLETRFKNREEGSDIIRWKLKKSLPFEMKDVHLDYQVLREKETGELSTLVSLISRPVIRQYEDLILEAGLEPNRIDFSTFNLSRIFSRRLDLAENAAMVTFHGGVLGLMIFHGGVLEFFRSREVPDGGGQANRLFLELNSSLLVYRDTCPGHAVSEVFCLAPEEAEGFRSIVEEATGLEPVMLNADQFVTRKEGLSADRKTLNLLAASLGAAVRNL